MPTLWKSKSTPDFSYVGQSNPNLCWRCCCCCCCVCVWFWHLQFNHWTSYIATKTNLMTSYYYLHQLLLWISVQDHHHRHNDAHFWGGKPSAHNSTFLVRSCQVLIFSWLYSISPRALIALYRNFWLTLNKDMTYSLSFDSRARCWLCCTLYCRGKHREKSTIYFIRKHDAWPFMKSTLRLEQTNCNYDQWWLVAFYQRG